MARTETATLGGGCFWCLEAVFEQLRGVERVVSGYAGGRVENPSYEDVCSGTTGHAEVVQVTFDPEVLRYRDLLEVFFSVHDPTTLDRQGPDAGPQYRSIVLHHGLEQRSAAEDVMRELAAKGLYDDPVVTELAPFRAFHPAEDHHQGYFRRNPRQPYCTAVVAPKVTKFREKWAARLKPPA